MNIIVWELILVLVVALGLGFWQLYDINRELRKDRDKAKQAEDDQRRHSDEDAAITDDDRESG